MGRPGGGRERARPGRRVGRGDVTLRAKWRFLAEARGSAARLRGPVRGDPAGDELQRRRFRPLGLGPNTLRAFMQGLFDLGARAGPALHANLGALVFDEVLRPHEQRDFLLYGLACHQRLGRSLEAVAEVAGRAGDERAGGGAAVGGAARAALRPRARAGRRRGAPGPGPRRRHLGGTLGLSWSLRTRSASGSRTLSGAERENAERSGISGSEEGRRGRKTGRVGGNGQRQETDGFGLGGSARA